MISVTARPTVEAMDDLIVSEPVKVLDHGFVELVDYMGDDAAIVQAARVSYNKGTVIKNTEEGTIRHMMREGHTSPFEMCEIKFHVKLPIFVARQWIRHRTANVNEMSARYSILDNEFYIPDDESNTVTDGLHTYMVKELISTLSDDSYEEYERLLSFNVTRERARMVLPTNIYTQWYWKIDLANLFHFLKLRTDNHAQWEIRQYANVIEGMVARWVPMAYKAWVDYQKEAVTLGRSQINLLNMIIRSSNFPKECPEGIEERDFKQLKNIFNIKDQVIS
ncbi:unnamed protein product [Sphagnum balticum]